MKTIFLFSMLLGAALCHGQFAQKDLNGLHLLNGSWHSTRSKGLLIEQWNLQNDSSLAGKSFLITGADTLLQETMTIQLRSGQIQFISIAKGQNNDLPVTFTLQKIADGQYLFENRQHDFPQQIAYHLTGQNSLHAFIAGNLQGTQKQIDFYFQRKKEAYDAALAQALDADEYGMKQYVLALLVTGKADIRDPGKKDKLMAGHMANMSRLAAEGKLLMAGPFSKNNINGRGMFILNTPSVDEAKKMVHTDPAVAAGIFEVVYLPWYGSAALPKLLPIHESIQKTSF